MFGSILHNLCVSFGIKEHVFAFVICNRNHYLKLKVSVGHVPSFSLLSSSADYGSVVQQCSKSIVVALCALLKS